MRRIALNLLSVLVGAIVVPLSRNVCASTAQVEHPGFDYDRPFEARVPEVLRAMAVAGLLRPDYETVP